MDTFGTEEKEVFHVKLNVAEKTASDCIIMPGIGGMITLYLVLGIEMKT